MNYVFLVADLICRRERLHGLAKILHAIGGNVIVVDAFVSSVVYVGFQSVFSKDNVVGERIQFFIGTEGTAYDSKGILVDDHSYKKT